MSNRLLGAKKCPWSSHYYLLSALFNCGQYRDQQMAASRVAALAALLHSAQAGLKVTELYSGAGDANGESM